MAEEQLELLIEDDAEGKNEPELVIEKDKPKKEISAEEGIDELRAKLQEEQSARAAAEARAREAAQRAAAAENEVGDTHLHLVKNAIDTVKRNNEILRANMAGFQRAGDFDKAAELQEQISTNAAKLVQLENGKTEMEQRPQRQAEEADPVEAMARQLTPKSAAWLRAHPEFARDPAKNVAMISAHNLAVSRGLRAESEEYFEAVENLLDVKSKSSRKQVEDDDDPMSAAATMVKPRTPPSAPVERSGTPTGERKGVIRLTRDQVEAAEASGLTPQEYYKNMQTLKKEGRLGS